MIPDEQMSFFSGDSFTIVELKRTELCIVVFCNDPVPGGQVTWDTTIVDKYSVVTNNKSYFVF